jgi:hypothetical protein
VRSSHIFACWRRAQSSEARKFFGTFRVALEREHPALKAQDLRVGKAFLPPRAFDLGDLLVDQLQGVIEVAGQSHAFGQERVEDWIAILATTCSPNRDTGFERYDCFCGLPSRTNAKPYDRGATSAHSTGKLFSRPSCSHSSARLVGSCSHLPFVAPNHLLRPAQLREFRSTKRSLPYWEKFIELRRRNRCAAQHGVRLASVMNLMLKQMQ